MTIFPEIDQGHPSYAAEMERHVDSVWRFAIFEVLWSGTKQYQKIIERDGLEAKQRQLGQIRTYLAEIDSRLAALAKVETNSDRIATVAAIEIEKLSKPDFRRDCVSGRLVPVDNGHKVALEIGKTKAARAAAQAAVAEVASLKITRASMADTDERLAAALVMFCQAEAHRRNQPAEEPKEPAAPVINVTVEAPVVNVEAPVVNLEAVLPELHVEVTANLPARKTETEIHRNDSGEMIGSTAVETSL
jgi:hypothetical protein